MRALLRSSKALDQLLNSASSAVFSLGLVAATDNASLGRLAIGMTALPVLLGLARTSVYESLLIASAAGRRYGWLAAVTGCGAAAAAFLITLPLCLLLGTGSELAVSASAVSAAVLIVDGLRFAAFAEQHVGLATSADAIWLLLASAGVVLLITADALSASNLAWVYGASAGVAGLFFTPLLHAIKRTPIDATVRTQFKFGLDFVLQVGPGQVALIAAGLAAGLDAVGVLRGAVTLFAPLATVVYAIRLVILGNGRFLHRWFADALYFGASALYTAIALVAFASDGSIGTRAFGTYGVVVLSAIGAGESARHMTQAVVDRCRNDLDLRTALSIRSVQAVLLVLLTVLLGVTAAADGLATARVLAFGLPLIYFWMSTLQLERVRS